MVTHNRLDQIGTDSRSGPASRSASATAGLRIDFGNDQLPDGTLKLLHAIWEAGCDDGKLASRAHFDPVTIPTKLLPWITIFDVTYDPVRYRVRIVGTGLVGAMGVDTTGSYLDELAGFDRVIARANWLLDHRKAFFLENLPLTWVHERYSRYSVVGLPLASNGRDIDMLLYGMSFGY